MLRISDVLAAKSTDIVVTVPPSTTVRELAALLKEHNIGAVVVSEDGESVDAIVSERDIVRHLAEGPVLDLSVADIMTREVRTISPDDSIDGTRQLMTDQRIRHLPVVVNGKLRGLVSIGDIVKSHIAQVEYERDQLDSYISS